MKSLVRRTNVKSTVDEHSNQIDFVLVRCEASKICIKSSKCFLPIEAGGKTVRFLFDKNIQKWQFVVFLDLESEFNIWVKTVDMLKKPIYVVIMLLLWNICTLCIYVIMYAVIMEYTNSFLASATNLSSRGYKK